MNDNLTANASKEAEIPAFLVGDVIGSACSRHKPKQLGYLQCFDWLNDDSNKEKHLEAKQYAYRTIVNAYENL